jgi:hypothetical protein
MSSDTVKSVGWPQAVVPEWLFLDKSVPGEAIKLYCVLSRLAQRDGYARPLRTTLAEMTGWSVSKVDRTIADLVDVKAVRVKRQYRDGTRIPLASHYLLAGPRPFSASADAEDDPVHAVTGEGIHPQIHGVKSDGILGEGVNSLKINPPTPQRGIADTGSASVGETGPSGQPPNGRTKAGTPRKVSPACQALTREIWNALDPKPLCRFVGLQAMLAECLGAGYTEHALRAVAPHVVAWSRNGITMAMHMAKIDPKAGSPAKRYYTDPADYGL